MARSRIIRHELSGIDFRVLSLVAINSVFHLTTEISDETLDWPSSSVTKSANGVTLNLEGKFFKHINFSEISITLLYASKHINHPPSTLTARCALTTALVLVELSKT